MTRRMHITVATLPVIVATLWIATGAVFTQEPSSSPPQAETSTESWNFPQTVDGQPDIQGMWVPGDLGRPLETPAPSPATRSAAPRGDGPPIINIWHDVTRTRDRTAIIVDPSDGTIPWQPWAVEAKQYISAHQGKGMDPVDPLFLDPVSKCLPYGVPRINSPSAYSGYQFLQRPGMVVIHYEQGHQYRIIRLDERPHVGEKHPTVEWQFTRTLGGQHTRCRRYEFQRQDLGVWPFVIAGLGAIHQSGADRGRALRLYRPRHDSLRGDDDGSEPVFAAVDHLHQGVRQGSRGSPLVRVRVLRGQPRHRPHNVRESKGHRNQKNDRTPRIEEMRTSRNRF